MPLLPLLLLLLLLLQLIVSLLLLQLLQGPNAHTNKQIKDVVWDGIWSVKITR